MNGHERTRLQRQLASIAPHSWMIDTWRPMVGIAMLEQSLNALGMPLNSWLSACLDAEVMIRFGQEQKGQTRPWQDLNTLGAESNELLRCMVPLCLALSEGQRQPALEARLIALLADRHWHGPYTVLRDKLQHTFLCMAVDGGLRRIGNDSGFRVGRPGQAPR